MYFLEEEIVFFNTSVDSTLTTYLEANGVEILENYTQLNAATITGASETFLDELKTNNIVATYGHNLNVTVTEPIGEPKFHLDRAEVDVPSDWGYLRVKSQYANEHGLDGTGVKAAIFDTGLDAHHEYLEENFAGFKDIVYGKPDPYDDHGHGTHCGGIVKTVAPNVSLYGYKLHERSGANKLSDILKGLDVIVEDGMDVVNMSFGLDTEYERGGLPVEEGNRILNEACSRVVDKGVFLVAAAGNERQAPDETGRSPLSPANCPDVFAVGASQKRKDSLAYFSNLGFDIVAPGNDILSSLPNNRYASWSGTSMAAPFIVGAIAAVKSAYGSLSNEEIKGILVEQGDHITSHSFIINDEVEYDILNMENVTNALETRFK